MRRTNHLSFMIVRELILAGPDKSDALPARPSACVREKRGRDALEVSGPGTREDWHWKSVRRAADMDGAARGSV